MKSAFLKIGLRLAIFQSALLLCQNLLAVTFTDAPSVVSNTFNGTITLQIGGIPAGDTVVVQKFCDVNADSLIDTGDLLVQQFNLTDGQAGMVIAGVTNINVPRDMDATAGQITATLNFPGGDFVQNVIGKYGFILSSPVGHFTPITNFFTVTNFPYAQTITGTVASNGTSVAIPYATIMFFPAPRSGNHGPGNPVAGTVANGSGIYTIHVPPGTYVPLAFKSNYVANYSTSPVLTLNNTQTISTNLSLIAATAVISGKIVDANNPGTALPGLFEPAIEQSGSIFITAGFSDTNGNFTIGVTAGQWDLSGNPLGLALHGYVAYDDGTNVNAGTTGFVGLFYKATSLFYGSVKDNSGNPLAGIAIEGRDNNDNEFDNDGYSDANGNYVTGVYGGLGGDDAWMVDVDNSDDFPNYIFLQSAINQNGGTNLAVGKAILQNFTAIPAINHISGNVQDSDGNPISGVEVYAYTYIGSDFYQAQADTDGNGNYSMNVANELWMVNVLDCCDDDSLSAINPNYGQTSEQFANIENSDATNNFVVPLCDKISIVTTNLPDGQVGSFYDFFLQAESCNPNPDWTKNSENLPPGLSMDNSGEIYGNPTTNGTYNFSVHVDDGNGHTADQSLSLNVASAAVPLQITTTNLPNGNVGAFYNQQLNAMGGQPPYSWSRFIGTLPDGVTLSTNGVISGTPATNGLFSFIAQLTDANSGYAMESLGLIINPKPGFGSPSKISATQFQFQLNGASNQNYTVQVSTNLSSSNWSTLVVTNSATSDSFLIVDPHATNKQRFYRALIGP